MTPRPARLTRAPTRAPRRAGRPGVALVAALWLVVAIAAVGLLMGVETRTHRAFGAGAAERTAARAAALGALARTRARLERALRDPDRGAPLPTARAADPWLDAGARFADADTLAGVAVAVRPRELGALVNVNVAEQDELQAFIAAVLRDGVAAGKLAAAILDWRRPGAFARAGGADRADYERLGRLVLPTGADFRDVDDLRHVIGMTPERFALLRPYLTTRGSGRINVNAAPEPVLHALPGAGDDVVARILAYRAQGRRIRSLAEVVPQPNRAAPGGAPGWPPGWQSGRHTGRGGTDGDAARLQRLAGRATLDAVELEVALLARAGPQAAPVAVRATVTRAGTRTLLSALTWQ